MKRLAVYCGSSMGANSDYTKSAKALGLELVKRNIGLVYGGGNVGLMGEIANTVIDNGGEVIGIIPEFLEELEVGFVDGSELRIVPDMHTRKASIVKIADGFIAMPGGFGTFEEVFEALTWAQLGLHSKPVGFLNASGYYDSLLDFINHALKEKFIAPAYHSLLISESDPETLINKFENYVPPNADKADFAKKMTNKKEP